MNNSNDYNCSMDKHQKLLCVVEKLQQLTEFVKPYLPLANVHNTNFLVSHHWDTMIPEEIRLELLKLDDNELALLPSGELYNNESDHTINDGFCCDVKDSYASRNQVGVDCSFSIIKHVEAITSARSNIRCVTDQKCNLGDIKTDIRNILTVCHPSAGDMKDNCLPEWDHTLTPDWQHKTLSEFIMAAVSCTLPQLGLLTSLADLRHMLGLHSFDTRSRIVVSHAMNIKKSYEVDIMSNLCAWIAKGFNVSSVSIIVMCIEWAQVSNSSALFCFCQLQVSIPTKFC